ncbi:MAG TPA: UDP-N-acetylmuramoyl-L-alanyl-D-glutamate--2,6-diaminopimelate ligase [Solirubrobacteraceae bacterium]
MRLDALIAPGEGDVQGTHGAAAEVEITGLAYDSREVQPGTLFFCVKGFRSDGHDFAAQAVERGATALVVERPLGLGVPEVVVSSARAAMGPAAVRFYGDPSAELRVVGVTGTNGKTTTAFLLKALLEASGSGGGDPADRGSRGGGCGLLGTVKSVIGGVERGGRDDPIQRTTPEAIDLQADLRAMLDGGDWACAIEVSSHALELGRAEGIHFAAAIFTNLTQDHLDFHATMEDYFKAKRRLFEAHPGVSVVNVGDLYGRRLAQEIDGALTFAVEADEHDESAIATAEEGGAIAAADYRATDLRCDFAGCRFRLHTPVDEREVTLPMAGRFNVANALGALAAAHALAEAGRHRPLAGIPVSAEAGRHPPAAGIPVSASELDVLIAALERGVRVPGRFEAVDEGQDFAVLVDYAHTPDSLENVLIAARELTGPGEEITGAGGRPTGIGEQNRGRVVCVFGAGGDRDRGKRPLMGEIAARGADVVVVTSDNPRSEDPEAIIAEILAGTARADRPEGAQPIAAITDRRAAISQAIAGGRRGDVVVIAGKGHEQGQEFADGRKLPFDDVSVAREVLRALTGVGARAGAGA